MQLLDLLLVCSGPWTKFSGALHQLQRRAVKERDPIPRERLFASLLEEANLDEAVGDLLRGLLRHRPDAAERLGAMVGLLPLEQLQVLPVLGVLGVEGLGKSHLGDFRECVLHSRSLEEKVVSRPRLTELESAQLHLAGSREQVDEFTRRIVLGPITSPEQAPVKRLGLVWAGIHLAGKHLLEELALGSGTAEDLVGVDLIEATQRRVLQQALNDQPKQG